MYKLEVKLKQHTPMIHFQHDQEGATLRATEVKPKLDRFIIKKVFSDDFDVVKEFLIGYDSKKPNAQKEKFNKGYYALDYKMRIESDSIDRYTIPDRYSLYFGNMGDNNQRKEFTFCKGLTSIVIYSFHIELRDLIEKHVYEFFLLNNFGSRQSKGFGSFYIDKESSASLYKAPLKTGIMDYRFKVSVSGDIFNQWRILFEHIELFYKILRSGINICNRNGESVFYMKSMMFKYAKKEGFQWDKKSIKEKYYPHILKEQKEEHDDEDIADVLHFEQKNGKKYLFKDLLGLSSTENWRAPYNKMITKESVTKEIERFKSPIIFKPIRIEGKNVYNVLFKGTEIPKKFLNKDFKIKDGKREDLKLTTYPEFDINDFLDYSIFDVDLEELVGDEDYLDHPKFKTLENMFNQIRTDYGL